MTGRTRTGARLVDVPEVDPVKLRDELLGEAFAVYTRGISAAFDDYLDEHRASWDRYQARREGLIAEHQAHVAAIRSAETLSELSSVARDERHAPPAAGGSRPGSERA